MTQETITEEQKASLEMLKSKYDTEYLSFKDGEERTLQFSPGGWTERKSEKFGTDQVVFDVIDPSNPFVTHKLSMSSKRAIRAISDNMLEGNNLLHMKKTGQGNATKWFVDAV